MNHVLIWDESTLNLRIKMKIGIKILLKIDKNFVLPCFDYGISRYVGLVWVISKSKNLKKNLLKIKLHLTKRIAYRALCDRTRAWTHITRHNGTVWIATECSAARCVCIGSACGLTWFQDTSCCNGGLKCSLYISLKKNSMLLNFKYKLS